jgi:hypothetical protein
LKHQSNLCREGQAARFDPQLEIPQKASSDAKQVGPDRLARRGLFVVATPFDRLIYD